MQTDPQVVVQVGPTRTESQPLSRELFPLCFLVSVHYDNRIKQNKAHKYAQGRHFKEL